MTFFAALDPFSGGFGVRTNGTALYYLSNETQGNVRGNWAYTAP